MRLPAMSGLPRLPGGSHVNGIDLGAWWEAAPEVVSRRRMSTAPGRAWFRFPPQFTPRERGIRVIPLVGMRKTIADRMQSSAQQAPHIALHSN